MKIKSTTWHVRGAKKKSESPTGIEPMAFQIPVARSKQQTQGKKSLVSGLCPTFYTFWLGIEGDLVPRMDNKIALYCVVLYFRYAISELFAILRN